MTQWTFLKKITDPKLIRENDEKYGVKTSMYLHSTSDLMVLMWTKDIIEAEKLINNYKKYLAENVKDLDLLNVISIFRDNGIANPKMVEELKNLQI